MSVEYDFYIDERNRFIVPEKEINYLFSVTESEIPELAENVEATVKIAGRDGDVVLESTYEPLEFLLTVYTEDNLTPTQKIAEINKVTEFLHSIKKSNKKFAILQSEKMYEVKYHSQLTTTTYPKFVKFEIPLKSSKSFATELTKNVKVGNQTFTSNTIQPTGFILTIEGPTTNPVVSLNNYQMTYTGTVLDGNKLIINTNNSTATHVTSLGVRTNAAIYYNHQYPRIQNGSNQLQILSGISDTSKVTIEWYDLKL